MRQLIVLVTALFTTAVYADDQNVIKSASIVLALTMQTDDEIIVDTPDHAHLANLPATFEKIGPCTYAERLKSLSGEKFLIVNFNKLTGHYGYTGGEIAFPGVPGETKASCFQYNSLGVRCSGALHVPRGVDENLLVSNLVYVQQHGCGEVAF